MRCGMMKKIATILLVVTALSVQAKASGVILDPGHSPAHPGALSCSGNYEYLYNESLTRTVVRSLHAHGIEVDLTRKPGEDMALKVRAERAKGKSFFLSLHHDSAQPQFLVQKNGTACSEKSRGYSLFVSGKNAYFEQSLAIAKVLGNELRKMGFAPSKHHGEPISGENRPVLDSRLGIYRYDDLVVLKYATCPAVLLEAAVIVHPEDDALARTVQFHTKMAGAIEATVRYVLLRNP